MARWLFVLRGRWLIILVSFAKKTVGTFISIFAFSFAMGFFEIALNTAWVWAFINWLFNNGIVISIIVGGLWSLTENVVGAFLTDRYYGG